ncbi:S9 family peptidase [Thalassotalea sp. PS06]|uniref:S9 family peptidase n=1 Tax=Thalassotalea sp. PS06 TaxID=2594005 RepID=UPI00116417B8|nr:S9 family peptidase [Thalassotalea sp. PS06]QDP01606.1 S9 family peptidase [Thalassotalea sp. PS06]
MSIKTGVLSVAAMLMLAACGKAPETSETDAPAGAETKAEVKIFTAEEFFATTTVFGSSINHDGTAVLVSNDATGVFNAYRYPLDGSEPEQLTKSDKDTVYGISWFPEDNRFIYTADQGGNELNHLYVRELDGSVKDLTPGDNLKAGFLGWNDNGDFYAFSNERDPKAFDVYRYSSKDYQRELVFQNDDLLSVGDVSRDGRWLSLTKAVSGADSDLYLIDLSAEEASPIHITPHEGNIEYFSYGFTPDSSKLIFGTDEHSEFSQAWAYDLESGESELFYETNWDVSFVYFSKDGKYTVIGVNDDAQTKLTILDSKTKESVQLPELPPGDLAGVNFSNDSIKMVFYINADNSPSNLYTHTLGSDKIVKLTDTLNPAMTPEDLVMSEVVRFSSFDGLEIPGLLYKPLQASADNKVPALVWVHGGPGGQSRKGYRAAIQHLVNNGYAIFAVNNRGSSGYGKTFYHLDDKQHGEGDLQDIVYGKKHLQTLDWVDGTRIGIIGGSYGGYMTMAGMAFTDEFEVGINIFGVTNWVRTLNSIPPWWEAFKKALYDEMGDPATDAERHRRISPLFHAENIKKPVLVVQGANDPRVLQVESDEMVAAIEANNVPVEYVLFEDEGHGFRKKANRITASNAYVRFLDRYLKNSANQL